MVVLSYSRMFPGISFIFHQDKSLYSVLTLEEVVSERELTVAYRTDILSQPRESR